MTPAALRADAARNRERLIAAAGQVFATQGLDAGVDEIARTAGVGIGTLYRRFPTRDDLVHAVLEDTFDRAIAQLDDAASEDDPWTALERGLERFSAAVLAHSALLHSIAREGYHAPRVLCLKEDALARFAGILERAQTAGVVRADVVPNDLMALSGMLSRIPPHRLEREPDVWRRWLALMLDGLRPEGAHPLP
jgi:AcrR family transcriptional regulator